jgi:uncharacterized protein YggE
MDRTTFTRGPWLAMAALVVLATATTTLLVSGGHGHPAAAATPTSSDTVTVSGVGTVQGVPDTLSADFNVHVTRGSVQGALDAEGNAVRRVLAALKQHGIVGRKVQTASLSLSQHYDSHGRISGYDADETVTAKISPLSGAGRTIAAAATASGNDVLVGGLSFDIEDDQSLLADTRAKAYADAKARAQQYAQLTGRQLGTVSKVSETVQTEQPVPQPFAAALAASSRAGKAVPIRAGEQPVTVTVTVVWRLT